MAFGTRHVGTSDVLFVFIDPVLTMCLGPNNFHLRMARRAIERSVTILVTRQAVIHHRPVLAAGIVGFVHPCVTGLAIQFEYFDMVLVMEINDAFGRLKRNTIGTGFMAFLALLGVRHFQMTGRAVRLARQDVVHRCPAAVCPCVTVSTDNAIVINVCLMRKMDQSGSILLWNRNRNIGSGQTLGLDKTRKNQEHESHRLPLWKNQVDAEKNTRRSRPAPVKGSAVVDSRSWFRL